MVLSDALFSWFYDEGFPANVQLSNVSGGTEIAGFGIANSLSPVFVGGCSGRSLGTPLSVFDANIEGRKGTPGNPVKDGVPGELVATAAFPNIPVAFWGPNGKERYHDTYFAQFDSEWTVSDRKSPFSDAKYFRCMDPWGLCHDSSHNKTTDISRTKRWSP